MRVAAFCAGFIGFGLAAAGALLAREEADLFSARLAASQAAAGKLKESVSLARAVLTFDRAGGGRPDVLRDKAYLQRRLIEEIGLSPAAQPLLPAASRRLEETIRDLAVNAPMPSRAWCDLSALFVSRGVAAPVDAMLALCFEAPPPDRAMIEVRWRLALILWPRLPPSLREKFLRDIDRVLGEPHATIWDAELLAEIVARNAPRQGTLIRERLAPRRKDLTEAYDAAFFKIRNALIEKN